jgi:GNAT superfamily N-acetyltransferase
MSGQTLPVPPGGPSITIRRANPEDAPECGRVCFDAFYKISTNHGFPCHFPSPEVAVGLLSMMFSHPGFYCVVAESDECVVGSNCLDERSAIAGLGPITVDPRMQDRGVGRKLMEAVLVRARERNSPGVRLLQSTFHNRSLTLYSRLGFDARELVSVMQGPPLRKRITGYATALAFFGHAVAETNLDLQALIASAEAFAGPGIIVPARNSDLFRF